MKKMFRQNKKKTQIFEEHPIFFFVLMQVFVIRTICCFKNFWEFLQPDQRDEPAAFLHFGFER